MQWWNWRGAVGVGTSSSADDAALNSRQGHGYNRWLDLERIPHTPVFITQRYFSVLGKVCAIQIHVMEIKW
jgi:hypothetical protein